MNEELKSLYKKVILEHNKTPQHFYENENADQILDAYNPVCGDRFRIYLVLENDRIQEASFKGYGCAISKASISIMMENILGKTIDEVKALYQEFDQVVHSKKTDEDLSESTFQVFAAAQSFPGRMDCVTLGWEEMMRYIGENDIVK